MKEIELKNNPINTCIIQVGFFPILIIENKISELQDAFRKSGFPSFHNIKESIYSIDSKTQDTATNENKKWLFSSVDEQEIIILDKSQITFQVARYTNFINFIDKFNSILTSFSYIIDFTNGTSIKGMGLRYANCVEKAEDFKKFFKDNYHGISLPTSIVAKGDTLINSNIACLLDEDNDKKTNLLLKVYQNNMGIMIPMNVLALKECKSTERKIITFFDLDLTMNFNNYVLKNLQEILDFATELNKISSKVFFDSITEEGRFEWT